MHLSVMLEELENRTLYPSTENVPLLFSYTIFALWFDTFFAKIWKPWHGGYLLHNNVAPSQIIAGKLKLMCNLEKVRVRSWSFLFLFKNSTVRYCKEQAFYLFLVILIRIFCKSFRRNSHKKKVFIQSQIRRDTRYCESSW